MINRDRKSDVSELNTNSPLTGAINQLKLLSAGLHLSADNEQRVQSVIRSLSVGQSLLTPNILKQIAAGAVPKSGRTNVPKPGTKLSQNRATIFPKTGQDIVPKSGKKLSQNWAHFWMRNCGHHPSSYPPHCRVRHANKRLRAGSSLAICLARKVLMATLVGVWHSP